MFTNKTIIITGASSGIGQDIAASFLQQGANIVINARSKQRLEEFANRHAEHQSRIRIVAGDIADKSTGNELARVALEQFGSIDVLVNNAGVFIPKPFLDASEAELDMYLGTALKGSFFTSQAVIPEMIKRNNGSIINIGSMWVEHPLEATPCSASQVAKGGVHTLTRHLAIEFATNNIRVNTIAPAVIDTPLYDDLMARDNLEQLANLHPLRRLGSMTDITSWVLHLAGTGGRFVTGQTLMVDGGITAGAHTI
jgi:NAD(P)-dependent dehydrogenase (short-subunit alcohol dehydrogenase family)